MLTRIGLGIKIHKSKRILKMMLLKVEAIGVSVSMTLSQKAEWPYAV